LWTLSRALFSPLLLSPLPSLLLSLRLPSPPLPSSSLSTFLSYPSLPHPYLPLSSPLLSPSRPSSAHFLFHLLFLLPNGRWMDNKVTHVNYDRLRIDKALGFRKSDNNRSTFKRSQRTTFVAIGDLFRVQKGKTYQTRPLNIMHVTILKLAQTLGVCKL